MQFESPHYQPLSGLIGVYIYLYIYIYHGIEISRLDSAWCEGHRAGYSGKLAEKPHGRYGCGQLMDDAWRWMTMDCAAMLAQGRLSRFLRRRFLTTQHGIVAMPCSCPCNDRTPRLQCGLNEMPRYAVHRCGCRECGHSGCHVRIGYAETYCWVCTGFWQDEDKAEEEQPRTTDTKKKKRARPLTEESTKKRKA